MFVGDAFCRLTMRTTEEGQREGGASDEKREERRISEQKRETLTVVGDWLRIGHVDSIEREHERSLEMWVVVVDGCPSRCCSWLWHSEEKCTGEEKGRPAEMWQVLQFVVSA